MSCITETLSFNVAAFLEAPKTVRKALRYLAWLWTKKIEKGIWKTLYKSVSSFSHFVTNRCKRTLKRVVSHIRHHLQFFVEIKDRYKGHKQEANQYILSEGLLKAIKFLEIRNKLEATKDQYEKLIEEARILEEKQKMSPPPPKKCPPIITPFSQTHLKRGFVHPKLEKIGSLNQESKEILSRFPEYLLMLALEDGKNWKTQIPKVRAFLLWRIQIHKNRQQNLKKE